MTSPRRIQHALGRLLRSRLPRSARDRGTATVFVLGITVVLFGVAGLAIDGGKVLNEKDRAFDVAEQAARAGANQVDLVTLRSTGQVVLDDSAARNAAVAFVGSTSDYALVSPPDVTGTSVTVSVKKTITTNILGIIGIGSIPIEGSATARPVAGINNGVIP